MSPRNRTRERSARPRPRPATGERRRCCFPRNERLLLRGEFKRASAVGARRTSPHFIVYHAQNQLGRSRLGITVSRKVGKAVVRNRVKRFVREYFRASKDRLPASRDFVIIARRGAGPMSLGQVGRELDRAIGAGRAAGERPAAR